LTATLRVATGLIVELPPHFGSAIHTKTARVGPADAEGWITLELSFASFEAARDRILGLGGGVEVLEPRALRRSVLDYAERIVALYTH
jgi:predicted DNA-binding transcriptional regulator YafY